MPSASSQLIRRISQSATTMTANFDRASEWRAIEWGIGPYASASGGHFDAVLPATSTGDGCGGTTPGGSTWGKEDFGAIYESIFKLHGDFTVDVEFSLTSWPIGNGGYGANRVSQTWVEDDPRNETYVFGAGGIIAVIGFVA